MDKELNDNELENVLGGANPKAVDERLQNGYTKTFRDKVLEDKLNTSHELTENDLENVLAGANPKAVDERLQNGYTKTFRDKVLEDKLAEMEDTEERGHVR